ncbi:hypothetical protein ACWF9G_07215 [Nocardia sp. NPDC055029]
MHPEEEAIIDFALRLQPVGGPSAEEIRDSFSLSRNQFRARVREILGMDDAGGSEPVVHAARALLRDYFSEIHERACSEALPDVERFYGALLGADLRSCVCVQTTRDLFHRQTAEDSGDSARVSVSSLTSESYSKAACFGTAEGRHQLWG